MKSKIEWTQHTWNPVTGCTKTSEGCQNCYAENMAKRFGGKDGFKVTLHPEKLFIPLSRKKPTTYFVCSMSDLFHEDVSFEYIDKILAVMALTPYHTYQVLTKRPVRMREYFEGNNLSSRIMQEVYAIGHMDCEELDLPLVNVWLGVTAENQKEANHRIPILLSIPAALRFVSVEPMLEEINLGYLINHVDKYPYEDSGIIDIEVIDAIHGKKALFDSNFAFRIPIIIYEHPNLDWVICGGESGQRARPLNPHWVNALQEQCAKADVPFFFKQWGEFTCKNGEMIRVGKKEAGYFIDGKEYREMPKVSAS